MAQSNKICEICSELGHSKHYCRKRIYKSIPKISKKRLLNPKHNKVYKPINKKGKKAKAWDLFIPTWKENNPCDENGYWYCKIGGFALTDGKQDNLGGLILNLGHDISRTRDSTKITDLNNVYAICQKHNKLQGSMSFDEFLETNPDLKCGNF